MEKDDQLLYSRMNKALEKCVHHVQAGGIPFVGIVFKDGAPVSDYGVNRVMETGDYMAHAEIVAMREAEAIHGLGVLEGAELFATGEPCGLCYKFALDRGVSTIYVAADRHMAARWGFDYRGSYAAYGITGEILDGKVHYLPMENVDEPFRQFVAKNNRFIKGKI